MLSIISPLKMPEDFIPVNDAKRIKLEQYCPHCLSVLQQKLIIF